MSRLSAALLWLRGLLPRRKARRPRLIISADLWEELMRQLRRRGDGRRESGAFLLGPRDGDPRVITEIVYLDDLDPDCLTGGITFDGRFYGRLWDICHARELHVRADIHTHPSYSVRQSSIDQDNPMVSRSGHLALIVPRFATVSVTTDRVGFHEFLGAEGWRSHFGPDAAALLRVE